MIHPGPRRAEANGKTTLVHQVGDDTPVRSTMPPQTSPPSRAGHGSSNGGNGKAPDTETKGRGGRSWFWTRSRR